MSFHVEPFLRKKLHTFGIKFPFQGKTLLFYVIQSFRRLYGVNFLTNDWTRIHSPVDKMNCATPHTATVPEGVTIPVHTGKRGEESRMDIHNFWIISGSIDTLYKIGGQGSHKPGKHKKVDCLECHKWSKWKPRTRDCSGCHEDAHRGQFKGTPCARCHQPSSFKKLRFNHDTQSRFPLRGRHRRVDCARCHTRRRSLRDHLR